MTNRAREAIRLRHRADPTLSAARYDEIAKLREILSRVVTAPGSNALAKIQQEIRIMARTYGSETDVAKGHSPEVKWVFASGDVDTVELTDKDRRFKR